MPKDEWGVKRLCPHCASRFYDLQRDPMTCPECSNSFTVASLTATRGRMITAEKAPVRERSAEVEDLDAETDLEDETSDVDLDDDLLEEDEEDSVSLDEIADVGGSDEET